ncbi:hypothetical protein AAH991_19610 [Microbispora sp. ZYX-F-249]|uniref:Uncharacterized protein n=1 Tax=Microbispora maris TaxID=3144104 RepID=A0ABV0APY5_9ACTN
MLIEAGAGRRPVARRALPQAGSPFFFATFWGDRSGTWRAGDGAGHPVAFPEGELL